MRIFSKRTKGMIFVKGGTFVMGCRFWEKDEMPFHDVILSDYFISKYEVTQMLYEKVMGKNPSFFRGNTDPVSMALAALSSNKPGAAVKKNLFGTKSVDFAVINSKIKSYPATKNPVECVSWYDAVEFCNKLSEKMGLKKCYSGSGENISCDFSAKGYRLPTEAEWEYAAEGGRKSRNRYECSGSNYINRVAWYIENSGEIPHIVGSKKHNELGIYDMSGNVSEWCWDWYGDYSSDKQYNHSGPDSGSDRVIRGGNCLSMDKFCRVKSRGYYCPDDHKFFIGFRIACSSK